MDGYRSIMTDERSPPPRAGYRTRLGVRDEGRAPAPPSTSRSRVVDDSKLNRPAAKNCELENGDEDDAGDLPPDLTTIALAPTSSPLPQQRFMGKATAPAPAGSRITPSSQAVRLRNSAVNSRGDLTREYEKQHEGGRGRESGHRAATAPVPFLAVTYLQGQLSRVRAHVAPRRTSHSTRGVAEVGA